MRSDELMDLMEELGLNKQQKIGTLLNEVEALEIDDDNEDEDEGDEY